MIGVVVVGAIVFADQALGNTWLTPAFLAALATLITALTGLVVAFRAAGSLSVAATTAKDTHAKVTQVATQTNGVLDELRTRNAFLEKELAGLAHRAGVRSVDPTGPTSAPQ